MKVFFVSRIGVFVLANIVFLAGSVILKVSLRFR